MILSVNSLFLTSGFRPLKYMGFIAILLGLGSCVPKTQYEDQQSQLDEAKAKVREMQAEVQECDPDMFIQLKEQAQSLDILTQELVDRNTELAGEVSRLRAYETQVKGGNLSCEKKIQAITEDYEGRLSRTRVTYEDLIKELNGRIKEIEKENAALRRAGAKSGGGKTPAATKKP